MEEDNELQQRQTLSLNDLNEKERQAVEMRYLGKTSQEIGEATGYNDVYVRNLFMQGGRLEKAYRDFAHIQQGLAQEKVASALNRAREEALSAIERIIALSKDASNEAAIFKANEFLLSVAGVNAQVTLRTFLLNKSYEHACKLVDDTFKDLYGKTIRDSAGKMTLVELAKQFSDLGRGEANQMDGN